jgi:hypothetical protein
MLIVEFSFITELSMALGGVLVKSCLNLPYILKIFVCLCNESQVAFEEQDKKPCLGGFDGVSVDASGTRKTRKSFYIAL